MAHIRYFPFYLSFVTFSWFSTWVDIFQQLYEFHVGTCSPQRKPFHPGENCFHPSGNHSTPVGTVSAEVENLSLRKSYFFLIFCNLFLVFEIFAGLYENLSTWVPCGNLFTQEETFSPGENRLHPYEDCIHPGGNLSMQMAVILPTSKRTGFSLHLSFHLDKKVFVWVKGISSRWKGFHLGEKASTRLKTFFDGCKWFSPGWKHFHTDGNLFL